MGVLESGTELTRSMCIKTTTHLNYRGDARAALEFYQSVFGGETVIATYGDFGMPKDASGADNVVFSQLETADGFRVMAYDVPGQSGGSTTAVGSTYRENGVTITDRPFFVSVRGETLEEIEAYWAPQLTHQPPDHGRTHTDD